MSRILIILLFGLISSRAEPPVIRKKLVAYASIQEKDGLFKLSGEIWNYDKNEILVSLVGGFEEPVIFGREKGGELKSVNGQNFNGRPPVWVELWPTVPEIDNRIIGATPFEASLDGFEDLKKQFYNGELSLKAKILYSVGKKVFRKEEVVIKIRSKNKIKK